MMSHQQRRSRSVACTPLAALLSAPPPFFLDLAPSPDPPAVAAAAAAAASAPMDVVEVLKRNQVLLGVLGGLKEVNLELLLIDGHTLSTDNPGALLRWVGAAGVFCIKETRPNTKSGRGRRGGRCNVARLHCCPHACAAASISSLLRYLTALLGCASHTLTHAVPISHSMCCTPTPTPAHPPTHPPRCMGARADPSSPEWQRELDCVAMRLATLFATMGDMPAIRYRAGRPPQAGDAPGAQARHELTLRLARKVCVLIGGRLIGG